MNRKSFFVMALAALVAGAAVLVYAQQEKAGGPDKTDEPSVKAPVEERTPAPATGAETGDSGVRPEVLYDLNALPEPVKRMFEGIISAAVTGEIENLRPVLESNELKPMVAANHIDDPIAFWKKESADGNGREVLAAMLNVLASGFVKSGTGQDEMYVWPYFAETDLGTLRPAEEVEFYRIVPAAKAVLMKQSGKYAYWRLGISPGGVWHYFLQ